MPLGGLTPRTKMKKKIKMAPKITMPKVRCRRMTVAALRGLHLELRTYGGGCEVLRGGNAKCMAYIYRRRKVLRAPLPVMMSALRVRRGELRSTGRLSQYRLNPSSNQAR